MNVLVSKIKRLVRPIRNWVYRNRDIIVPEQSVLGMASSGGTFNPSKDLSAQERIILKELCTGLPRKTIADNLKIADRTVESYLARIYRKIEAHSAIEAVNYAYAHGIANPPARIIAMPEQSSEVAQG